MSIVKKKGSQSKSNRRTSSNTKNGQKKERRNRIAETKDPNRKFLKELISNFLNPDATKIQYDLESLFKLLDQTLIDLTNQPTLLEFEAPTYVCGDIHGQITDLRRILHICGYPNRKRFLFLGDYVDRGAHSIEVISTLFAMRLLFKDNVFLLRGNHEVSTVNCTYGFQSEVLSRFVSEGGKAKQLWDRYNEVFAHMPLAAVISEKILCMHGGISPRLSSISNIRALQRPIYLPKGLAQDILWADPKHGVVGFPRNEARNTSVAFGEDDLVHAMGTMGIAKILRAHEVSDSGWMSFCDGRLLTLFSATRLGKQENGGAFAEVSKNLEIHITKITPPIKE